MSPPEPSSTRKRLRSRISDEADELSPLPAKSQTSAAKRQKVDVPTSTLGGISGRFKKLLGLGVKKETEDSPDELGEDIYDFKVTDDEEENTNPSRKSNTKPVAGNTKAAKSTAKEAVPPPKRGRGRPPKNKEYLEKAKALSRQAIQNESTKTKQNKDTEASNEDIEPAEKSKKTYNSRSTRIPNSKDVVSKARGKTTEAPESSTPKRGRPKRIIDGLAGSTAATPKGILTPSKSRNPTIRKSVAFDESGKDNLEGFKDIPSEARLKNSQGKTIPLTSRSIDDYYDEEDDDGPVCEICTKPDSVAPNKILFCDGCPLIVHQKCYSVPKIPEGDWFCKKCQKARVAAEAARAAENDGVTDSDDEISCAVCQGLDSEKPNEIILCENCDYAVHQSCGNIPKKPRGEWLCETCVSDVDHDLLDREIDLGPISNEVPSIEGFETHLKTMQRVLLNRLTGEKRLRIQGHEDDMHKVHQLVEQTVLAGEGNSMLLIGARGSGKTTLVESVISDLGKDHRQKFHVVRLNGFVHTDDRLALREIWRQLGREMEIEDDSNGKINNYADTLASLLALLSHPSEISEIETDHAAKSVVFVLDEFDLFTTHSRQTLLYNLFDIAQARKAPIAVLGLTTRVDVVESLEKRVKSRFSHRYVHLSLPRSLPAFWEVCKQGLIVDSDDYDDEGFDISTPGQREFLSFWQNMIEKLYNNDKSFKHHMQSNFYRSKSGLSELELAMLIAAARLDIILDTDTCNFAMAYDEYSSLTSRHKIQTSSTGVAALGGSAKVWGRDVALGAWERLVDYDLLISAAIGAAQVGGIAGRMWKVDIALEEIPGSVEGLTGVMLKWCREI
ncbi:origin recognition complex subunit [Botrytis cinerea]